MSPLDHRDAALLQQRDARERVIELAVDDERAAEQHVGFVELAHAGLREAAEQIDPRARPMIGRRQIAAREARPTAAFEIGSCGASGPSSSLRRRIASAVMRITSTTLTRQNIGARTTPPCLSTSLGVEVADQHLLGVRRIGRSRTLRELLAPRRHAASCDSDPVAVRADCR